MFNITYLNPEWQLTYLAEDNPAIWLFNVNGFVIDIRMAPVDVQEEAYQRGLIPFVPAYRKGTEEKEETEAPLPKEEIRQEEQKQPEEPADFSDIYKSFGVEP